jgi:putative transposase
MQRLQGFKFELRPNGAQERQMRRIAGSCRFVYNKALVLQKERCERGGQKVSYAKLCRELTAWRNGVETPWLKDAPTHALQQALKNLTRAYSNYFENRSASPRFKKRGHKDSFTYPDPKQFKLDSANGRVFLPKLGWMRLRLSRKVLGCPCTATVRLNTGRWFVSIQTKREVEQPVHPAASAVGIDLGIVRFATLSDGSYLAPLNGFGRHQQRLRRSQQAMSRKVKFSRNWHKARERVQRIHARIGSCRRDYLHKASTTISKNHAIVCVEDLQVRNMSRSAAGTAEHPGMNVRAKSGLNRSILDQGWYEFRRQLQYKLEWRGGALIAVPAHHSSREWPACGQTWAANRKTQERFACIACGYEANADLVGALNVLARGHRVAACGEGGSGSGLKTVAKPSSAKQEPTEETVRDAA